MLFFFLFYLVFIICECNSFINEQRVSDYFKSDTFSSFQEQWQKERKSYENAIRLSLKDSYGYKGMNVYIRKSVDSHRIANGFYVYDNVVGVMGQHMFLGEIPHFTSLDVTFALASNVLRLETGLSKIFIYTQYIIFRNHSDIVFGGENSSNHSPFAQQDVQHDGPLAIIAEDCSLSGYAIIKLDGQSVDVGHNHFKVSDCKFSIEISATGMGIAPITEPYFNHQQSVILEKLISKPIRDELLPKLQASLLTYVNTTNIFEESLRKYQKYQTRLFKETSKDIMKKIRVLNKNTIRMNQGMAEIKSFSVVWSVCEDQPCYTKVYLNDVFLHGLETMYSPYSGGPYKLQSTKVGECIRFHYLQVRGKVGFKNGTRNNEHEFFAEIHDASVNIEIDLDKQINTVDFVDWRKIELSMTDFKETLHERIRANSLIVGHLLYEVPMALKEHTLTIFGGTPRPAKLSYDSSGENSYETNVLPNSSQDAPLVSQEDNNDRYKKKVFDKRGEISKGGLYKPLGPSAQSFINKKKVFDKRGEVSVKKKVEEEIIDDPIPSQRSSSLEHQNADSDNNPAVISELNAKGAQIFANKKKIFDKRGEVSVKKKVEEEIVDDPIPSQRSSSLEHQNADSDNSPAVISKLNAKGMPTYKNKALDLTSSSSIEEKGRGRIYEPSS